MGFHLSILHIFDDRKMHWTKDIGTQNFLSLDMNKCFFEVILSHCKNSEFLSEKKELGDGKYWSEEKESKNGAFYKVQRKLEYC